MKRIIALSMACALVFAQSYTYNPLLKYKLDATGARTTYTGGSSGAVTVDNAAYTVDLTSGVVPLLAGANVFTGLNSWTPSATQSITAVGNTVLANANNVAVSPTSNLTLTSTPTIANGVDGQMLKICNVSTSFSLTLQDEANLVGSNIRGDGSNVTLSPRQCRIAEFRSAINDWVFVPVSNSSPIIPSQETLNACASSFGSTSSGNYGSSWHWPGTNANKPFGTGGLESFSSAGTWAANSDGPTPCYIRYSVDAVNDQFVFARHTLPLNWLSGQTVTFAWALAGGGTGTGQMVQSYACAAATTANYYTVPAVAAFTSVDSMSTAITNNQGYLRTTSGVTLSGCTAGDTLWVQYRRTAHASNVAINILKSMVVVKVQ